MGRCSTLIFSNAISYQKAPISRIKTLMAFLSVFRYLMCFIGNNTKIRNKSNYI